MTPQPDGSYRVSGTVLPVVAVAEAEISAVGQPKVLACDGDLLFVGERHGFLS